MNSKIFNQVNQAGKKFVNRARKSTPHSIPRYQPVINFIQNKKVRHCVFLSGFIGTYLYSLYRAKKSENDVLRMGAAGSITILISESAFYFIDAVNGRSKILNENVRFIDMIRKIVKNEGIRGLYKGYSASFYSSIMYGYLYFYLYKGLKVYMKDHIHPHSTSMTAFIYASASTIAEVFALILYYPFELVKVRLLTKNDIYKYNSVSDAFLKIVKKDHAQGLYRGVGAFFFAFMGQYTLQMTTYELIIDSIIKKKGQENYRNNENYYVITTSIFSGVIAAFFTNFLEVIVVRKQSESGESIAQLFKEQGTKIFTKGLTAKVLFTSCQSVTLFMSMNHIGKIFHTNLSEENDDEE